MYEWYFPEVLYNIMGLVLVTILGALVLAFLAFIYWKRIPESESDWTAVQVLSSFIIIYMAFLVFSSTTTAYHRINDRLLSPVYLPTVILGLLVVQIVLNQTPQKYFKATNVFAFLIIVLYSLAIPVRDIIPLIRFSAEEGAGYYSAETEVSLMAELYDEAIYRISKTSE